MKLTIKHAKEIVNNNPDAKRLINFAKSQGLDVYYGSHNKRNPWYGSDDGVFDVVSVGKGRRSGDFEFILYIHKDVNDDDTKILPEGNLSEMLEYFDDHWNTELSSFIVNDYMKKTASSITLDGETYNKDEFEFEPYNDILHVWKYGKEDEYGQEVINEKTFYSTDKVVFIP